jgi:hypothetical protein
LHSAEGNRGTSSNDRVTSQVLSAEVFGSHAVVPKWNQNIQLKEVKVPKQRLLAAFAMNLIQNMNYFVFRFGIASLSYEL